MKKITIILIIILTIATSVLILIPKEKDFEKMTIDKKVEHLLDEMTFEEKIAQMLIIYYTSDTVDETLLSAMKEVKPGGFILMKENISTYEKTKKFVDTLKENSKIPLIISIDQEGGLVQRLSSITDKEVTMIPDMFTLGSTEDENLAYEVGKVMAEEMRTIGINVTFAPVVDIYSNKNNTVIGKRSFGTTPSVVSKMSISFAKGLEENGIIATYKHFPGHGDTDVDSHISLPIINKTLTELQNEELIPFKNAIENNAKIIMIGHLAVPNITGNNKPASLSKEIITDLLKEELGYNDLIITDALNMGALTENYNDEEIYKMAIEAGIDLILMPNGSRNAIELIKKNVSEERINESVRKILTFKYTYLEKYNTLDVSYLGNKEHKNVISKVIK